MLLLGVVGVAGCGELDSSGSEVVHVDGLSNGVTAESKPDWYTDDDIDDAPPVPTPTTEPIPTEPIPTQAPTYEPPEMPELDRTELDANLAALSPADKALVDHHLNAPRQSGFGEGTVVVAAPMRQSALVTPSSMTVPTTAMPCSSLRRSSGGSTITGSCSTSSSGSIEMSTSSSLE